MASLPSVAGPEAHIEEAADVTISSFKTCPQPDDSSPGTASNDLSSPESDLSFSFSGNDEEAASVADYENEKGKLSEKVTKLTTEFKKLTTEFKKLRTTREMEAKQLVQTQNKLTKETKARAEVERKMVQLQTEFQSKYAAQRDAYEAKMRKMQQEKDSLSAQLKLKERQANERAPTRALPMSENIYGPIPQLPLSTLGPRHLNFPQQEHIYGPIPQFPLSTLSPRHLNVSQQEHIYGPIPQLPLSTLGPRHLNVPQQSSMISANHAAMPNACALPPSFFAQGDRTGRACEIQIRNMLCPPHLRSASYMEYLGDVTENELKFPDVSILTGEAHFSGNRPEVHEEKALPERNNHPR